MQMIRAVFDASALIRAGVDAQPDAQEWLARLELRQVEAAAPDLIWAEVAHALRRHVRAGRLATPAAGELLLRFLGLPLDVRSLRPLAPAAYVLAGEHGVSVYDAFYLALAEAAEATLVTADRRLGALATSAEVLA